MHFNDRELVAEITYACNLRCPNCDRRCDLLPDSDQTEIWQIRRFLGECRDLGRTWDKIRISGGEPSLHPGFKDICRLFLEYIGSEAPRCSLTVLTNGTPAGMAGIDSLPRHLRNRILIMSSNKGGRLQPLVPVNMAPMDLGGIQPGQANESCKMMGVCGITFNKYGIYPSGICAGVDRVFKFDAGLKSLADVTEEALLGVMRRLCAYCGRDWRWSMVSSRAMMSKAWQDVLKNPPDRQLTPYGGTNPEL